MFTFIRSVFETLQSNQQARHPRRIPNPDSRQVAPRYGSDRRRALGRDIVNEKRKSITPFIFINIARE
jgi:hypothetical protein